MEGYPDGTFRPQNQITRIKIVRAINRMLKRGIAPEDIPDWAPSYSDLQVIPESVKICHSSTEDFCCQVVRKNRRNACCLSRFYRAA
ncbi:MAG: S-layer homology domain-containing protein [Clostridiales bacterium]|jgi:hypothetical protein|nr:S-layer homology domain-containing protein [Clostridiales bacterium]